MRRREFITRAGVGSVALASLPAATVNATGLEKPEARQGQHNHAPVSGPLANATVSFGQWAANGLDRFPNLGAPAVPNGHQLIPHEVMIKAGGTVNFIIAGFHQVIVYDDGTQPDDIDTTATIPNPPGPPLIDFSTNRVYRGLNPIQPAPNPPLPQDRVEVVQFPNPGTYLVICGVLPHFANDGMYGFVKVNP